MPRSRNDSLSRLTANGFRMAGWSGVYVALVLLSPLSSRGQESASSPAPMPVRPASSPERPPFDLKYVTKESIGVIALRPNIIFSDPAMQPLARMANEAITELLPGTLPANLSLRIEEIEQVIGFIAMSHTKGDPKGVQHFMIGLVMIRTARDYDWRNLLRQLDPKMEEVPGKGPTCYKCRLPTWLTNTSPGPQLTFFIPDKRTLVSQGPGVLQEGQVGGNGWRPSCFSWHKDWQQVERGLFAVAMDNRWAKGLSAEQIGGEPCQRGAGGMAGVGLNVEQIGGGEPWANALTQHAATMVAGVDWKDGIDFQALLSCKDGAAAKQTKRDVRDMLGLLRFEMDPAAEYKFAAESSPQKAKSASLPPDVALQVRVWQELMKHSRVTRQENTVCVQTRAKINIAEIVKMFQFEAAEEKKP